MLWAKWLATLSRWARITWDGANTAGIGVAHKWDHVNNGYSTAGLEHSDEVFQDMKRGSAPGDPGSNYGWNDAEVSIIRSKFIRNSEAGVSVESWNALNYWIWDSEFTDNARGVTNIFRAGNFHVYRSVFRNSSIADIHILHTSCTSVSGNTSIGSNRFLLAEHIGPNSAAITLQDNKILDTVQADAISDSNVGPLFLIDNVIRSRPGASGPAVTMHTGWATGPDLVSVGNKFTVAAPISVMNEASNARSWAQDDQVVPYASIDGTIPTLPATPVSMESRVFEIAPGANSAEIQQAGHRPGRDPLWPETGGALAQGRLFHRHDALVYSPMPTYRLLAMAGAADCSGPVLRLRDRPAAQWPEQGDLARVRARRSAARAETESQASRLRMRISRGPAFTSRASWPGFRFKPRCSRTA